MAKRKSLIFSILFGGLAGSGLLIGSGVYKDTIARKGRDENYEKGDPAKGYAQRDIYIDAVDRITLHSVFVPMEKNNAHTYALVLRDYSQNLAETEPYVMHYLEQGFNVLIPDARGTGESGGLYRGYGYDDRLDVLTWLHWILKQDEEARIFIHGLGSGANAALLAASEHLPKAVFCILSDSAFTDLPAFLTRVLKFSTQSFLPVRLRMFLLKYIVRMRAGFDIADVSPLEAVSEIRVPVLFMHGDTDHVLPVDMCKTLYGRAQCTRQIAIFLGAGHLKSAPDQPERYFGQSDAFIARHNPDRV